MVNVELQHHYHLSCWLKVHFSHEKLKFEMGGHLFTRLDFMAHGVAAQSHWLRSKKIFPYGRRKACCELATTSVEHREQVISMPLII